MSKCISELCSENEALKKECKELNEKIDQAWGQSSYLEPGAFIPGAFDAWKRPVKQFLPYDFSGNPGASATQYCNGWNDAGGYWVNHVKDMHAINSELLAALEGILAIVGDSGGVAGYHLNGDIAEWGEFEEVAAAHDAIAKTKGGAA